MADSFLGSMLSGGAKKPADMNDPAYTSPEAIKARISLADQLTGRATQPFAPHWSGILAAGLTGLHGAMGRGSAEAALAQNTAMEKKANEAAAMAPDNIAAGRAYAMSGVPSLGMKGVEHVIAERNDTEKKAIERHRAESERIKAQAALESVPKTAVNPVSGEYYATRSPPPTAPVGDEGSANRKMMAKNYFASGGYRDDAKEAVQSNKDARDQLNTLRQMEALLAGGKVMTGTLTPEGLAMRKAFASVLPAGWVDSKKISDTEVFQFLSQKGIFDFVKQLKPASNTDFVNAERAALSVRTDPSTLPVYMPMLKNYALRSEMSSRLRINMIKGGQMPDDAMIETEVNRTIPLYVPEPLRNTSTPASGQQTGPRQFSDRLPPGGAPAPSSETAYGQPPVAPQQSAPADFRALPRDKQRAAALRLKGAVGGPNEQAEAQAFREAFGDKALGDIMSVIKGANFQPAAQ